MSDIELVKSKLDIVDLVSESVKLRKSGRTYTGFCPFHANTRTPAFYVFPDTQSWHCFGACSTGGDIFTFVMKKENIEFAEALRRLAARAGVTLSRHDPASDHSRQTGLRVLQAASERYHWLLKNSPAAQFARDYIAQRQIKPETAELFQLGFAPNEYESLKDFMLGNGYELKDIEAAGLVSPNQSGSGYHDRFRGRIMFPIRNRVGEIIAFGARALDPDAQPKYLNSPDTPLFSKSATLYGLDLARDAIHAENLAVIVEGYMDVIIAHQAGFKNVVASLGTALTEKQLGLLKRQTRRYALALDADKAGADATRRGLETARGALDRTTVPVPFGKDMLGFEEHLDAELFVIQLPEGRDPDELILKDPDSWRALVEARLPLIDFYLTSETRDLDLTSAHGKAEATKRLIPIIREIQDPVVRTHYSQQLARRLRVDERVIAQQVSAHTNVARIPKRAQFANETMALPGSSRLENYFLALALARPDLLTRVAFVQADDLVPAESRALFQALQSYIVTHEPFERDEFRATLDESLAEECARLESQARRAENLSDIEISRELEATAFRLQIQRAQEELTQITLLQQDTDDTDSAARLMERANELRVLMAHCQKQLQTRTLLSRAPAA